MRIILFISFSLILIFGSLLKLNSQNKFTAYTYTEIYNYSDSIYSEDDVIVNGIIYKYPNEKITGNPFLNENIWNRSEIFINGIRYSNYLVKYDLVKDVLIMAVKLNEKKEVYISLNESFIDSFYINNRKFVNKNCIDSSFFKVNFIHELFKGELSFFKVYEKSFIDIYDETNQYGKFSGLKSDMYLYNGAEFKLVSTKRMLIKYFGKEERKKMNAFLKSYKNDLSKTSDEDLILIMNYCNSLYGKK